MPTTKDMTFDMRVDMRVERAVEALRDIGERMTIWADVTAEIDRARRKHGTQHDTPMGTGSELSYVEALDHAAVELDLYDDDNYTLDCLTNAEMEQVAKKVCQDGGEGDGTGGDTWVKIIGEEFFEMVAADDPADLDSELVQVIAMGVSMLQAHRRQQAEVASA